MYQVYIPVEILIICLADGHYSKYKALYKSVNCFYLVRYCIRLTHTAPLI